MLVLPNFLIIGAMKAGTTSLHRYLQEHPQVFVSEKKELEYFTNDPSVRERRAWYELQFAASSSAIAIGEASTAYAKYPIVKGVPRRIAELIPHARLVYIIRHPIERMRSQYLHEFLLGEERRPIEQALLVDPKFCFFSSYSLQISQYLEYFPRSQLLVITAEDLRNDRRATLDRIGRFLDIPDRWETSAMQREFHTTAEKRVVPPVIRRALSAPSYRLVSPYVPTAVKRFARRWMDRRVDVRRGEIAAGVERELIDRLREDVMSLRIHLGPDFHCWGIV
jgi:hypothetical protein